MERFRIKRENDQYFPQKRFLYCLWWTNFEEFMGLYTWIVNFPTHEEARKYILKFNYSKFNEVEYLEFK